MLIFHRPLPSLPVQSWDQYVSEILGTEGLADVLDHNYPEKFIEPHCFRETQDQIEQWATGNVTESSTDFTPPLEEAYVCYGTVSISHHRPDHDINALLPIP
jgi:hypothetical protein